MASCAVFGHRNEFYYSGKEEKIYSVINDLVENRGVTEFYNGYRGEFDEICADYVYWLKKHGFPEIKNILVKRAFYCFCLINSILECGCDPIRFR